MAIAGELVLGSTYHWGQGELKNAVFETLVGKRGLPWETISIGDIPDRNDPRVKQLKLDLNQIFREIQK